MEWAVVVEGRAGPGAVVLLLNERAEAEGIANEMRRRGQRVVVRPYLEGGASGSSRR